MSMSLMLSIVVALVVSTKPAHGVVHARARVFRPLVQAVAGEKAPEKKGATREEMLDWAKSSVYWTAEQKLKSPKARQPIGTVNHHDYERIFYVYALGKARVFWAVQDLEKILEEDYDDALHEQLRKAAILALYEINGPMKGGYMVREILKKQAKRDRSRELRDLAERLANDNEPSEATKKDKAEMERRHAEARRFGTVDPRYHFNYALVEQSNYLVKLLAWKPDASAPKIPKSYVPYADPKTLASVVHLLAAERLGAIYNDDPPALLGTLSAALNENASMGLRNAVHSDTHPPHVRFKLYQAIWQVDGAPL